ncbi:hypothetical protein IV494_14140 [Kaistella sp. G5-32]|uniref:Protein NO VEIN C-terminal domain-containing protein n=1 Tax=Kaistella gelatinilytica TaxID=2787636 RepID=A0ABS0FF24_9FLAO|nr:hypothetical protein [Kaistella gelatinilytica]MBF8458320.1 hypothetical protein [Kaistella gelatinilytica]
MNTHINQVFANHYLNYKDQSVENIKRDARGLLHIVSDYEGRVVFELLQNAFDKAEKNIGIFIKDNILYVANDGIKFSYNTEFDYKDGHNIIRGDFQSICSVYTSTKSIANAIGNKGIGFKSTFSIAKNQDTDIKYPTRYVEIYTNGNFIKNTDTSCDSIQCAFRLFEMIRNTDFISDLKLDKDLLKAKIDTAREEYPDVGIPGYYFPIEIDCQSNAFVKDLLNRYVTVIAIPLEKPSAIAELIKRNIIESGIHFNFIQLKFPKEFHIVVEINDEINYEETIKLGAANLVSCKINNDELRLLAEAANIEIEDISIGLFFRQDGKGKFYNYLPTEIDSPFPNVDLHADFRTTLNRTNINWKGAVGEYNKALLRCCLELMFSCWNDSIVLNNKYIIKKNQSNVSWDINFFKPNFSIESLECLCIRDLFNITDERYNLDFLNFSEWTAVHSKKYFDNKNEKLIFTNFYSILLKIIHSLSSDYKLSAYSRVEAFELEIKQQFDKYEVRYLPNVVSKKDVEVFSVYDDIQISPLINLYFTEVEFKKDYIGNQFKKNLSIKDFDNLNEVIKHFKQCQFDGEFNSDSISESKQIKLLQNLYSFYSRKDKSEFLSSHRYNTALSASLRDSNSLSNQANFSVSTLFLKMHNGKYKPAQLCCFEELDIDFRNEVTDNLQFYKFLGVSEFRNFNVVDLRIYNAIEDGLEFIPTIMGYNSSDSINAMLLENLRIINSKNCINVHPSLVNDNHPKIFKKVSVFDQEKKNELENILVKRYDDFNKTYVDVLKNELLTKITFTNEIIAVYPLFFKLFSDNNLYIIFNGESLEIVTNTDFIIVQSKSDLISAMNSNVKFNILAYEAERGLYKDNLKHKIAQYSIDISNKSKLENSEVKGLLLDKLSFILYRISKLKTSDFNFIENDNFDILNKISDLKIFNVSELRIKKKFDKFHLIMEESYFIDRRDLLISDDSKNVIAKGLSKYLFGTENYASELEVIIFHTDKSDLLKQVDPYDFSVIQSKYDNVYLEKRKEFFLQIFTQFKDIDEDDTEWYVYNQSYKSASLQTYIDRGEIDDLINFVNTLKYSEIYRELNFKLQINLDNTVEDLIFYKEEENDEIAFLTRKIAESTLRKEVLNIDDSFGAVRNISSLFKPKKIKVFNFDSSSSEELESIGTNGEHDVLLYYINQFKILNLDDKIRTIESIYQLILLKVENVSYFQDLKVLILNNIEEEENYLPHLIPFIYITSKYKFSYFDLIGFKDCIACMVEVKSTTNSNNKHFYFSKAEINCALQYDNYEIVRCTPENIIFLGNPVKDFQSKLVNFKNEKYTLEPLNYKISYSS